MTNLPGLRVPARAVLAAEVLDLLILRESEALEVMRLAPAVAAGAGS